MKTGLIAMLMLLTGICIDHFWLSLLDRNSDALAMTMQHTPGDITRSVAACELSSEQIDHLSSRIAPAVVEHLATSGLGNMTPDPKVATQQRQAAEKAKVEQAEAFTHATQLVDQMIASRRVTPEGLSEARQLLQQTEQMDRMVEISGRIAVAVNKGQLTPAQAGLLLPGAPQ